MIFKQTSLSGAYIIDLEKKEDARGFFARAWCAKECDRYGLISKMVQANMSFNNQKGTLRGMHYQVAPHAEAKLVRCIKGKVYDVVVDLREDSPTYKQWAGVELTAVNRLMLYVPEHCAHGYLALEDDSEVLYFVSEFYQPGSERGLRYDDPVIGIKWPCSVEAISEKDAMWPYVVL